MVGWRLPVSLPVPPRVSVVDQAVVPDLGGLADDQAHAVVDDQALADLRPRVDLDAGAAAAGLGDHPGQEQKPMGVAPVGPTVAAHSLQAGVEQQHLQRGAGGGVSGLIGFDGIHQIMKHGKLPFRIIVCGKGDIGAE